MTLEPIIRDKRLRLVFIIVAGNVGISQSRPKNMKYLPTYTPSSFRSYTMIIFCTFHFEPKYGDIWPSVVFYEYLLDTAVWVLNAHCTIKVISGSSLPFVLMFFLYWFIIAISSSYCVVCNVYWSCELDTVFFDVTAELVTFSSSFKMHFWFSDDVNEIHSAKIQELNNIVPSINLINPERSEPTILTWLVKYFWYLFTFFQVPRSAKSMGENVWENHGGRRQRRHHQASHGEMG